MKDLELLEIAGFIAYRNDFEESTILINGSEYEIIDLHIKNTKHGLQAVTLQNLETEEYVIGFRGTDFKDLNDVSADASLLSNGIHPQFEEANKYYNKMKKELGEIKYVCGNSLGGGLANYVAVHHEEVNSVVYNPAILPSSIKVKDVDNIKNYISDNDPLTLVEIAAGLKEGIPGEVVTVRNNIPAFDFLVTNHVGYAAEKKDFMIELETGEVPIQVKLINGLPFSVFSNDFLSYDYQGSGKRIELNASSLGMLKNGICKLQKNIKKADKYLDESLNIVEKEGSKFHARMEELQEAMDEIFNLLV